MIKLFTVEDAALFADGRIEGGGTLSRAEEIVSVSVDSRTCVPESLFAAIPGEHTDGHLYIRDAFAKGAVAALVSADFFKANKNSFEFLSGEACVIVVENTLYALQKIAEAYLSMRRNVITIGVTGSNGKTTTKELIGAIVKTLGPAAVNEGNYNSDIGVALSAFRVTDTHAYGVFEMGMNRKGEMREIAGIVKPHAALITNIGSAHIGILGSKEAIAKEKKEIFSFFSGKETAYIYEEETFFPFLSEGVRGRVFPYGPVHAMGFLGLDDGGIKGTVLRFKEGDIALRLPGPHNAINALGAAALCAGLGADFGRIKRGIESVIPLSGRGEIVEGPVTVIKDCYNANPESLAQALSFMESLHWKGKKIAVIGSMKELGEFSAELHLEAAAYLLETDLDMAFFYGNEAYDAYAAYDSKRPGKSMWTGDMEELKKSVGREASPGALVLLKGSRSNALEGLMDAITGREQG